MNMKKAIKMVPFESVCILANLPSRSCMVVHGLQKYVKSFYCLPNTVSEADPNLQPKAKAAD